MENVIMIVLTTVIVCLTQSVYYWVKDKLTNKRKKR